MVDEPPVGALDPLLDRPGPTGSRRSSSASTPGSASGPGRSSADPRPAGGQGARELAGAGRLRGLEDDAVEAMDALQRSPRPPPAPGPAGRGRRPRTASGSRAALLVGASPAELEALGGARGAGVEQVALLVAASLPAERRDARGAAAARRRAAGPPVSPPGNSPSWSEATNRWRARRGARPVGAQHPDPSLGRPAPQRHPTSSSSSSASAGRGPRSPAPVQLGELGERRGGRRRGAQLERREGHGLACAAPPRAVRRPARGRRAPPRRARARPRRAHAATRRPGGRREAAASIAGRRLPAGDQLVRRAAPRRAAGGARASRRSPAARPGGRA